VKGATALAVTATLGGCSAVDGMVSGQPTEAVAAQFASAWAACGAPLTAEAAFDQAAVAKAGWTITRRSSRLQIEDFEHPLDQPPVLRKDEYEATDWKRASDASELQIIRWNRVDPPLTADTCRTNAKLKSASAVDDLAARMSAKLARQPDRKGTLPRGGDFLTPRFDSNPRGWYWQMPTHDAYLTATDHNASFEVVAMPDRSKLDQYSSDRPENRIPDAGVGQ
jgi:hypothetical protein